MMSTSADPKPRRRKPRRRWLPWIPILIYFALVACAIWKGKQYPWLNWLLMVVFCLILAINVLSLVTINWGRRRPGG